MNIASCTVIITSEAKDFNHGTGVAVRYGNQDYILTAAHALKGEPDNKKIMLLGRPNASLKEAVQKKQIPDAIFKGTHGRLTYSSATHVIITDRFMSDDQEDLAALKIQNPSKDLPHTFFHDLSGQGETQIS